MCVLVGIQLAVDLKNVLETTLNVIVCALLGWVVSLVCAPLVSRLSDGARLPRTGAALLALLVFAGCGAGVLFLVAGPLISESRHLVASLPQMTQSVASVERWLAAHGMDTRSFSVQPLLAHILSSNGLVVSLISGAFGGLIDVVIVLVTAFWLLRDGRQLRSALIRYLPRHSRPHADFFLDSASVVVGGYVRAQLLLALMVGCLAAAGCYVLKVPFPLIVGVAATLFELVPLIGALAGGIMAMLLASTVSTTLILEVAAWFLLIHILEGYLIAPQLQGRFVRLHPLVTFLVLLAGIEAGGILGGLIAIPAAGYAAVVARAFVQDWKAGEDDDDLQGLVARRRRLLRTFRTKPTFLSRQLRWLMARTR